VIPTVPAPSFEFTQTETAAILSSNHVCASLCDFRRRHRSHLGSRFACFSPAYVTQSQMLGLPAEPKRPGLGMSPPGLWLGSDRPPGQGPAAGSDGAK
jgi:hypothetical protein